jgi:hypothetical protein
MTVMRWWVVALVVAQLGSSCKQEELRRPINITPQKKEIGRAHV